MKNILTIVFLLFLAASAEAATYWASVGGGAASCAAASGTSEPATKRTYAQGAACLAPGDTLILKGGTYTDSHVNIPSGSASSFANATIVKNAPGETVTFTGSMPVEVYNTVHHIIIDGSDGNNTPCSTGNCTTRIVFDGSAGANETTTNTSSFIRFKGIEFKNHVDNGMSLASPGGGVGGHEVINSRIHNNGDTSGPPPQDHGIYLKSPNVIIDGNDIYDNCGAGVHGYSADATLYGSNANTIVRNNRIHNNGTCVGQSYGIIMSQGANMRVYNNLVYGNDGVGISAYQINADGMIVYNNTVYNNTEYGLYLMTGTATGTIWRNNISQNNTLANFYLEGGTATTSNNLCSTIGGTTNCDLNESPATTFNDFTSFTLKIGSLAINSGAINISPGINIPACAGGTTLYCYNGTLPDRGAFESGVPTAGGGPPVLTSVSSVTTGVPIALTVDDDDVNERVENTGDWVGIWSSPAGDFIDWFYMNGTKVAPAVAISDAVITFSAPATVGTYEFRFYQNGSSIEADRLATLPFTVTAQGIVLKLSSTTLKIGPSTTLKIGVP